jgi:hypothetical protein
MAIKISGNTVIDDSRKFIPSTISAGSTVGIAGSILASTGSGVEWVTDGGGAGIRIVVSNTTLQNGQVYMINAPGLVLTLPLSPGAGNSVDILNNVSGIHTLARNGSTIMNLSEDMTFGEAGVRFKVWYTGSTWSLF